MHVTDCYNKMSWRWCWWLCFQSIVWQLLTTHVFSPARSYIKATLVESRRWQHHSNCTDTSWHTGLSLKLRATQFGPLVPRHRAVCPTERRIWSPSTCMCSMSVCRQNPADLLLFISCTEPSHTINWPTHVKGNTHTHTQNHTLTQPHKHTHTHTLADTTHSRVALFSWAVLSLWEIPWLFVLLLHASSHFLFTNLKHIDIHTNTQTHTFDQKPFDQSHEAGLRQSFSLGLSSCFTALITWQKTVKMI